MGDVLKTNYHNYTTFVRESQLIYGIFTEFSQLKGDFFEGA